MYTEIIHYKIWEKVTKFLGHERIDDSSVCHTHTETVKTNISYFYKTLGGKSFTRGKRTLVINRSFVKSEMSKFSSIKIKIFNQ